MEHPTQWDRFEERAAAVVVDQWRTSAGKGVTEEASWAEVEVVVERRRRRVLTESDAVEVSVWWWLLLLLLMAVHHSSKVAWEVAAVVPSKVAASPPQCYSGPVDTPNCRRSTESGRDFAADEGGASGGSFLDVALQVEVVAAVAEYH